MIDTISNKRYFVNRYFDTPPHYPPRMRREKARSDYGLRLLQAREHAGLTQTALAKAVGMSQSAYASAETNGQGSTFTSQLAARCGVRSEWLAAGKGEMIARDGQHEAASAPEVDSDVMQALAVLAGALSTLDKATRSAVAPLLSLLAAEPDQLESVIGTLRKLIPSNTKLAHASRDDAPAGRNFSSTQPALESKEPRRNAKRISDQGRGRT